MKHEKKKRMGKGGLTAAAVTCLLLLGAAVLLGLRPDWRYVAVDAITHLGAGTPLETWEAAGEDMVIYTLEELRQQPWAVFDQSLLLVNEDCPLPEMFSPELVTYPDTQLQMDPAAAAAYPALARAVEERFGQPLYIMSAYRSREEQGETREENGAVAALPGQSEHETGLALDVYVPYYAGAGFLKSEAGQYVNDSCWQFGFIIRYPYYGTGETGCGYEPWHLRYVGMPHGEIIMKNRLTLERYLEGLEEGRWYQYGDWRIARQTGEMLSLPADTVSAVISQDHRGGYVVTVRLS